MRFQQIVTLCLVTVAQCCTTVAVTGKASANGHPMCSHSNDGDGDVAGRLTHVPPEDFPEGAVRKVQYGEIPQVSHTFAYKTEGYGIMNEFSVGLCESTCSGVFDVNNGGWGGKGLVTIVDLGKIALERASSAREAIGVMGDIATKYGFRDAAESLFVVDTNESWVFQILPDDTNTSAIFAAEQITGSQVAMVTNAFTIRNIDFTDNLKFVTSSNIRSIAEKYGFWKQGQPFDFVSVYSKGELGPKYNSGRRMWEGYRLMSQGKADVAPTYESFNNWVQTSISVPQESVSVKSVFKVMRSYYNGTVYDLSESSAASTRKIQGGPFGTSFRAHAGYAEATFPNGRWERPIATWKTQVSFVANSGGISDQGVVWFAPHAAHTAVYAPFLASDSASRSYIPASFSGSCSIFPPVDRQKAFWANRYVFHLSQIHFTYAIQDVQRVRDPIEEQSFALVQKLSQQLGKGEINDTEVAVTLGHNADKIVQTWWNFSEDLLSWYGEGNCNRCQHPADGRYIGYPRWWLETVGYNDPEPLAYRKELVSSMSIEEIQRAIEALQAEKINRRRTRV